jgi:hypothetical protein
MILLLPRKRDSRHCQLLHLLAPTQERRNGYQVTVYGDPLAPALIRAARRSRKNPRVNPFNFSARPSCAVSKTVAKDMRYRRMVFAA